MTERDKAIAILENCVRGMCEYCMFAEAKKDPGSCKEALMWKTVKLLEEEAEQMDRIKKNAGLLVAELLAGINSANMKDETLSEKENEDA